jgi:hypothetical protein
MCLKPLYFSQAEHKNFRETIVALKDSVSRIEGSQKKENDSLLRVLSQVSSEFFIRLAWICVF